MFFFLLNPPSLLIQLGVYLPIQAVVLEGSPRARVLCSRLFDVEPVWMNLSPRPEFAPNHQTQRLGAGPRLWP